MKGRIRLYGARMHRLTYRLAIFVGMMGLYSLALGNAEERLDGVILVAALTVGLVVLWFKSRKQRRLDRSHQLAAEIRELFPGVGAEEQDRAYVRRRRREMRLEALLYLILALLSAAWFWALYATDASPLTWELGVRTILPALALISAGLLAASFLPFVAKEHMPVISEEEERATLEEKPVRAVPPGKTHTANLSMAKKNMTPEEYIRKERWDCRGILLFVFFAFAFFFLGPVVAFAVAWYNNDEYLTFLGFVAFMGIAVWIILCLVGHVLTESFAMIAKLIQMRSSSFRAYRDTLQSHDYREDAGLLELRLSRSGTVTLKCAPEKYAQFFAAPISEVIVQTMHGFLQNIELLPGTAAEDWELADQDSIRLLNDTDRRQAALEKLERMTPERRKALEEVIERRLDVFDRTKEKGYLNLSRVEQGEFHSVSSQNMHSKTPDLELAGIESSLMKSLNVKRTDILRMKKNPFMPSLRRRLLLTALAGIGGNLGTAIVEKAAGADLGFAYLAFSIIAGSLALSCGNVLVDSSRFRKLQKAYRSPQYRKQLLDGEVYEVLMKQVERRREEAKRSAFIEEAKNKRPAAK